MDRQCLLLSARSIERDLLLLILPPGLSLLLVNRSNRIENLLVHCGLKVVHVLESMSGVIKIICDNLWVKRHVLYRDEVSVLELTREKRLAVD